MPGGKRRSFIRRRLIVFSPNRILQSRGGPLTLKGGLDKKLRQPGWAPEHCFFSASSDENDAVKQTWNEMKRVIPELDSSCKTKEVTPGIYLSRSSFEANFAQYFSKITGKCTTIMVMTISMPKDSTDFIATVVGRRIEFRKGPFIAMLESNELGRGWSEDQSLEVNSWNLINEDEIKLQQSIKLHNQQTRRRPRERPRNVEITVPDSPTAGSPTGSEGRSGPRGSYNLGDFLRQNSPYIDSHGPGEADDFESHPGKPDDVQSPLRKPDDVQPQHAEVNRRITAVKIEELQPRLQFGTLLVTEKRTDSHPENLKSDEPVQSPPEKPDDVKSHPEVNSWNPVNEIEIRQGQSLTTEKRTTGDTFSFQGPEDPSLTKIESIDSIPDEIPEERSGRQSSRIQGPKDPTLQMRFGDIDEGIDFQIPRPVMHASDVTSVIHESYVPSRVIHERYVPRVARQVQVPEDLAEDPSLTKIESIDSTPEERSGRQSSRIQGPEDGRLASMDVTESISRVQLHPSKGDDVETYPWKADDGESHLQKTDDVQSYTGNPDYLQSCQTGEPDVLQSRPGKPDSYLQVTLPGKPDDKVESCPRKPDDLESHHVPKLNHPGRPDANEWAEALENHDCKLLNDLLKAWKEDTDSEADGGDRAGKLVEQLFRGSQGDGDASHLNPIPLGTTAVHAAARRGDLKLLKFLVDEILHTEDGCSIDCNVLKIVDEEFKLDALAMALANGNQEIIKFLIATSEVCLYNPYDIRSAAGNGSIPHGKDGESPVEKLKEQALHENDEENMTGLSREPASRGNDGERTAALSSSLSGGSVDQLKKITKAALSLKEFSLARTLYNRDKDFNFLDINVYFFHFSFSLWEKEYSEIIEEVRAQIFSEISEGLKGKELLKYLLVDLKDGQGRTPLHVAVDSDKVRKFRLQFPQDHGKDEDLGKLITDILNAKDGAGRTPLYRAVARNRKKAVKALLEDNRVNVNARVSYRADQWGAALDVDQLSRKNSFHSDCFHIAEEKHRNKFYKKRKAEGGRNEPNLPPSEVSHSALHVAIILKHQEIVEAIVNKLLSMGDNHCSDEIWCHRRFRRPRVAGTGDISIHESRISTMKLAVLVESAPILRTLLKAEDKKPFLFTHEKDEEKFPSFHLAAAVGNVGVVKAFLDSNVDLTKVDGFQNTALHHAVRGDYGKFYPHLVDFVGCDYVRDWRCDEVLVQQRGATEPQNAVFQQDETTKLSDVQRKLTINLLLQVGINIWERNDSNMTANPESNASDEFTKWWYEEATEEVQRAQKKLNAAANAISVTAALVATASYIGPLTPPLGYGSDSIQENILALRVYVVCNCLSFYLALGAIMLALLPALPLPQESVFRELARTRVLVAFAVTFLFPSIICVLMAFASGYIAVIADHGLAYHGFLVAATAMGALLCFLVMIAFLHRLTKVVLTLPRDVWKDIGLHRSVRALVGLFRWISRSSSQSRGGRFQEGIPVLPQDQLQLLAVK